MQISEFAKKTFLALQNPYQSVCEVHPMILDQAAQRLQMHNKVYYMGVKNTPSITTEFIQQMEHYGCLFHTIDKMAYGGRAIDMQLVNPLSGRWMSGSSSGTALNVFYGINDIGIGSDGGGSVLAPAAALNLYGFISPLLDQEHREQFRKQSTDRICFNPSLGFITRDIDALSYAICCFFQTHISQMKIQIVNDEHTVQLMERLHDYQVNVCVDVPDRYGAREPILKFLNELKKGTILLSVEGPIDMYGLGDSVFGHFDADTSSSQRASMKGFMRVVTMANKSAITIPTKRLGCCILGICDSIPENILCLLTVMKLLQSPQDELVKRYFLNKEMYF